MDADQDLVVADLGLVDVPRLRTAGEPYLSWTIAFIGGLLLLYGVNLTP